MGDQGNGGCATLSCLDSYAIALEPGARSRDRVQGQGNSMGLILDARSSRSHIVFESVAYGKAAARGLMMRRPLRVADARSNGPDSVIREGREMFR